MLPLGSVQIRLGRFFIERMHNGSVLGDVKVARIVQVAQEVVSISLFITDPGYLIQT